MQPVDTFTHRGIECRIYQDEDARNPYDEWDNASRLLVSPALARDYGIDHAPRMEDASSLPAAVRYLRLVEDCPVVVPFEWRDYGSGAEARIVDESSAHAAGFVVVDRETIAREWNGDAEAAERCARAEFESFASWVAGDVYGYVVAEGTPEGDSCWGYYGYDGGGTGETDGAWAAAREAAEIAAVDRAERIRQERVYLLDPVAIDRDAYYAAQA